MPIIDHLFTTTGKGCYIYLAGLPAKHFWFVSVRQQAERGEIKACKKILPAMILS